MLVLVLELIGLHCIAAVGGEEEDKTNDDVLHLGTFHVFVDVVN